MGVAKFLISRKGLSRLMIGEYLGMIQQPFNMSVLDSFCEELDLSGTAVDVALRKFQSYFRMPGEAQKIERLMQAFSQRYSKCNQEVMSKLKSPETVSCGTFPIFGLNEFSVQDFHPGVRHHHAQHRSPHAGAEAGAADAMRGLHQEPPRR